MTTPLVIVGAGGFGRETAEAVGAINAVAPTWRLLGFADDNAARETSSVAGVPIIGAPDEVARAEPQARFVICTGRPDDYFSRPRIARRLAFAPDRYAVLVHPGASVAPSAVIGPGSVLLAGVVVTAAASIGSHVAVMPGSIITHDDVIGDFVTLASGVRLGGSVSIRKGAYVGAGALVREDIEIGAWSMIGMGSVVTRSVPSAQCWFGSPARYKSDVSVPDGI